MQQLDFVQILEELTPSTLDWLTTVHNLVKYARADSSYKEVEKFLNKNKIN